MNKQVLTIATGKHIYIDMAVNLARSFILWNKDSNISFFIVTDQIKYIPDDVLDFVKVIEVDVGEFGKGFSSKLHLDIFAPNGQTLFIDSDCLIYGSIEPLFEKFKGKEVSVIGNYISSGEWFGNIGEIIEKFQIPYMPKFNGGIYYLERGNIATKVYTMARSLEKKYDEIGFVRLRNLPNDEVIMALAMQLFDQEPITDNGSLMAEFINFPSGISSNLLDGKAILYNNPKVKNNNNASIFVAKPLIVHYLGGYNNVHPYTKEVKILKLLAKGYTKTTAKLITLITITIPFKALNLFKLIFRPFYRIIFGFRKIAKSERIIE